MKSGNAGQAVLGHPRQSSCWRSQGGLGQLDRGGDLVQGGLELRNAEKKKSGLGRLDLGHSEQSFTTCGHPGASNPHPRSHLHTRDPPQSSERQ